MRTKGCRAERRESARTLQRQSRLWLKLGAFSTRSPGRRPVCRARASRCGAVPAHATAARVLEPKADEVRSARRPTTSADRSSTTARMRSRPAPMTNAQHRRLRGACQLVTCPVRRRHPSSGRPQSPATHLDRITFSFGCPTYPLSSQRIPEARQAFCQRSSAPAAAD